MEGPAKKENPIKKALKKTALYLGTAGILAGGAGKSTESFSQTKEKISQKTEIHKESKSFEKKELEPIFVTDPNDPRLKEYEDSLRFYSSNKEFKGLPKKSVKEIAERFNNAVYRIEDTNKNQPIGYFSDYSDPTSIKFYPEYKKPIQPVFLEGTKEAKGAKKQQELKNAGFKINIDGDWGKKSQAAWDEYQRSKVKVVTEEEKNPEVQSEENRGVITNEYFPNPEIETERADSFMMPDGKRYTYEELLKNYPMMKSDSVFKANFPGRERPKDKE